MVNLFLSAFIQLGVATAVILHFYNMAFLFLLSDALPATNPLFRGKTGPTVFHIKVGASHKVPCPRTQQANLPACFPQPPINAERQAAKL